MRRQTQRTSSHKVVPPEILNRNVCRHSQIRRLTREAGVDRDRSPPSLIGAGCQLSELPELRPIPLKLKLHRSLTQRARALPAAVQFQLSGIAHIEIRV